MQSVAVALALVLGAALGCGGSRPPPSDLLGERFESDEASAARERAPDLYASAERVRREAVQAEEAQRREQAEDLSTQSRLLLEAAIAESDRIAAEERRLEVESTIRTVEEQIARDAARREEVTHELALREAARVASEQAALAFEEAVVDEDRRYRGRSEERNALHRSAAEVLARRASLLVISAEALGAAAPRVEEARALIDQSEHATDPTAKVELAERAMRSALVALGDARSRRPGPTADEAQALRQEAADAGFEVEQRDVGLAVRVAGVFSGSGSAPSAAGARKLARLAALVTAHPHGGLQVVGFASGAADAARQRLASARANRAREVLLRAGVPGERLAVAGMAEAPADADAIVEVVLTAYGPSI